VLKAQIKACSKYFNSPDIDLPFDLLSDCGKCAIPLYIRPSNIYGLKSDAKVMFLLPYRHISFPGIPRQTATVELNQELNKLKGGIQR